MLISYQIKLEELFTLSLGNATESKIINNDPFRGYEFAPLAIGKFLLRQTYALHYLGKQHDNKYSNALQDLMRD